MLDSLLSTASGDYEGLMTRRHFRFEFKGDAVEFRAVDVEIDSSDSTVTDRVRLDWGQMDDSWKHYVGLPDDDESRVTNRWLLIECYPHLFVCRVFSPPGDDGVCPEVEREEIPRDSLAEYDGLRLPSE